MTPDASRTEEPRMTYDEWQATVSDEIKDDSLWTVTAYRLALFMSDLGWRDTAKLVKNRRLRGLSDQLYRALGSVSANLAEGYSRGSGKDRARFYEYALGSARESRDWYLSPARPGGGGIPSSPPLTYSHHPTAPKNDTSTTGARPLRIPRNLSKRLSRRSQSPASPPYRPSTLRHCRMTPDE